MQLYRKKKSIQQTSIALKVKTDQIKKVKKETKKNRKIKKMK